MAPLRERLSHESVVESEKLCDGGVLLKAVVSIANSYAAGLLKNAQEREWLKHLTRKSAISATYQEHAEHATLSLAVDGFENAINSVPRDVQSENLVRAVRYLKQLRKSPNSFVSASANLYLALVWVVRHNPYKVAWHVLQMFYAGPRTARSELAPILWKQLFLPRFSKLEDWYSKEAGSHHSKQKVPFSGKISPRPSYSIEALYSDLKGFWRQLHPSSTRSGPLDQLCVVREERLEVLRNLYQESLDENTKVFALFYQQGLSQNGKGKGLKFPTVKTPQLRLQYVQKEILSRRYLSEEKVRGKTEAKEKVSPSTSETLKSSNKTGENALVDLSGVFSPQDHFTVEQENVSPAYSAVSYSSPLSSTKSSSKSCCKEDSEKASPTLNETTTKPDILKNMDDLKRAVATLCSVESLHECEQVVPVIARVWMESKGNPRLEAFLSKPVVIDVMMEFMATSKSLQTQRTSICLLTDLVHSSDAVRRKVVEYDPKFEWVAKTLRIPQAVVLLYLLKLSPSELEALHLVPALLELLREQVLDRNSRALRAPKAAAIFLLEQLVSFDLSAVSRVSEEGVPYLVQCLNSETPEEQVSVMVILLCCMETDQACTDFVARHCKPATLMRLVRSRDARSREIAVTFVQNLLLARKK